jgi:hypothetical protein
LPLEKASTQQCLGVFSSGAVGWHWLSNGLLKARSS